MKKWMVLIVIFFSTVFVMAMHCPKCGQFNPDGSNYCSSCGITLVVLEETLYCPQCGFTNSSRALYCRDCGFQIQSSPAPYGYPGPQQGSTDVFSVVPAPSHQHGDDDHHENPPETAWHLVGTVSSDGKDGAQELSGGGAIKKFKLRGASGSLIINTFVIREGGSHTPFPITTRFSPGQELVKDLPREFNSTGFRVSRTGKGSVEVYVQ